MVRKLEYVGLLSLAIIEKAKIEYAYHEKLVEFSAVSNYGIWRVASAKWFDVRSKKNLVTHLQSDNYHFANLKKQFENNETNFTNTID